MSIVVARKKKEQPQLFSLYQRLEACTENQHELGDALAYSILGSLVSFIPESGAVEEQQFEEVKAVYTGLETAITAAPNRSTFELTSEDRVHISHEISAYLEGNEKRYGSRLFADAIRRLATSSARSYQDRLRKDGITLVHRLQQQGPIKGRKNMLNHDYEMIRDIFCGTRK